MGGEPSVATLQTIIKVQQAINAADVTADAVMKIVVEQGRIATRAPGAVIELAEFGEMVYTATSGSLAGTEGLRLSMSPDPFSLRDRLVGVLQQEMATSVRPLTVGASCGAAVVGGGDLAEAVLARADAAMYADKRMRTNSR